MLFVPLVLVWSWLSEDIVYVMMAGGRFASVIDVRRVEEMIDSQEILRGDQKMVSWS